MNVLYAGGGRERSMNVQSLLLNCATVLYQYTNVIQVIYICILVENTLLYFYEMQSKIHEYGSKLTNVFAWYPLNTCLGHQIWA